MIEIKRVNKFFNRRKKNQIHVINDTSIKIEDTGLVAILGPSGCGKTTLLNVIGGLDNVNSGSIFVDGERITRRSARKIDSIRNINIGYIFQNYNLIDSKTVFENVALVLRMIGIKDKNEIEEKVNYVLEQVGMYRYRYRYADMLSGGERQRVAIARAIVKNPKIIIADEPTGNLDSKNTLEVMNIIKNISTERTVILVTHEEKLANFYANRIINLIDGKIISDKENEHENSLDYRIDNKIYLKDIEDHSKLTNSENEDYKINVYNEDRSSLGLDIVLKNGNIYVSNRNEKGRLEVVDENSAIEFIDDSYREISQDEYTENKFDVTKLESSHKPKTTSVIGPLKMLKDGFGKIGEFSTPKKILLAGFLISAMFATYGVFVAAGALYMPDSKFITSDKSYVRVQERKVSTEHYAQIQSNPEVAYALPGKGEATFRLPLKDFMQTSLTEKNINGTLSDSSKLVKSKMVKGRLPKNENEIVLDKLLISRILKEEDGIAVQAGYTKASDFVGRVVTQPGNEEYRVVGISDTGSPCIYAEVSSFDRILYGTKKIKDEEKGQGAEGSSGGKDPSSQSNPIASLSEAVKDPDIKLASGRWPNADYETTVPFEMREEMPLLKNVKVKVNGKKLLVVGYYKDARDRNQMVVSDTTAKYAVITENHDVTIKPAKSKRAAIDALEKQGFNVQDIYKADREKYKSQNSNSVKKQLLLSGITVIISLIEIYMMMRASFLSRIKEVGVYRAIGLKKSDIYKMFMGEIIAISTLMSLPGWAFMCFVISKLKEVPALEPLFHITPAVSLTAIIGIYVINIIFGLLPVWRVIRKTPASILARTDVD